MKVNVLTLYPEMFPGSLGYSLVGKALSEKKWELNVVNIRDFSDNRYNSVDDTPFGGGAGMIMRADILDKALSLIKSYNIKAGVALNPATPETVLEYVLDKSKTKIDAGQLSTEQLAMLIKKEKK